MHRLLDHPFLWAIIWLFVLLVAATLGRWLRARRKTLGEGEREDLNLILSATLTLLSLLVGFSFSMASARYDHRKNLEAQEASVIGTEYERASLLPQPQALHVEQLLRAYLNDRIALYNAPNDASDAKILRATLTLQNKLWESVRIPAFAHQNSITALVVEGMNEVTDAEQSTQAAWEDRVPVPAWALMIVIAIFSCGLIGYYEQPSENPRRFYVLLPLLLAVASYIIADLDSPRGGLITVAAKNLERVTQSISIHQVPRGRPHLPGYPGQRKQPFGLRVNVEIYGAVGEVP